MSVDKPIPDPRLDVLGTKVDALVKRHATSSPDDRNIPVLSDMVRAPDWQPVTPVALPRGITDHEAKQLAQEIFERVFAQVERELTTRFEERLTERMAAQISGTVSHVLSDLKPEIGNVIGDAINEALVQKSNK